MGELKHGRVAMVATIGYIAAKTSLVFPGAIALDGTQFKDLISSNPFTEWDLLPDGGKIQIFLLAAFLELSGEQALIDGGRVGEIPFIKARLGLKLPPATEKQEERRAQGRLAELKNGRLAMLGIAGFWSSEFVPGSVPLHF